MGTARTVRVVPELANAPGTVVVGLTTETELGPTAARLLAASDVVATTAPLDPVVALRAPDCTLPLQILKQCDLLAVVRIPVVLGALPSGVPGAPVEGASPVAADVATHEHVPPDAPHHDLPAPAAGVRAPAEVGVLLQTIPQEEVIKTGEDLPGRLSGPRTLR